MIKSMRIKNFKSIQDSGDIEFRPITIFIGGNNSGKSSFLQFLLMLKQTAESRNTASPLIVEGEYVRLGSFEDFIYGHETGKTLSVQSHIIRAGSSHPGVHDFSAEFAYDATAKRIELTKMESGRYGNSYQETDVGRDVTALRVELYHEMKWVYYLKPLRAEIQRDYKNTGETPSDAGLKGEQAVQVLFQDKFNSQTQHLLEKVEQWFRVFGFGYEPELEELGGNNYRLMWRDAKTNLRVNLADSGFGISQVLPIIVQGFYAPPRAQFIIEQPEIHLHPKAQAELGDLIVDIAGLESGEQQRTLLIETHSEHLIRRLQRRIAENKIQKEDVAVYFVEATENGSTFRRLELDEYGRFKAWPEGFFAEDADEMFAHHDAIFKRWDEEQRAKQPSETESMK